MNNYNKYTKKAIKILNNEDIYQIKKYFNTDNVGLSYYIPDLDISVSSLCLEMHYPSYEENIIYWNKIKNNQNGPKTSYV